MNLRVVLFFMLAAFAVSPAYGQQVEEVINSVTEIMQDILHKLVALLPNTGSFGGVDVILNKIVPRLQAVGSQIAALSPNLGQLTAPLKNAIPDLVSSTSEVGTAFVKLLKELIAPFIHRDGEIELLNPVLSSYRTFLIDSVFQQQQVFNSWSANPLNAILSVLGDSRFAQLTTIGEPVPTLCSLQANTAAPADSRALATAFLADIAAAMSQIKPGKCNGLSCITLILKAQQIARDCNCA